MSEAGELQKIVSTDFTWLISGYAAASAIALWIFDFIQTLSMEVQAVWSRRLSVPAVIFLVNRYAYGTSLIIEIVAQISPVSVSNTSCNVLAQIHVVFQKCSGVTTYTLLILRVYAMYGHAKAILGITMTLVLAKFGVDIWMYAPPLLRNESLKGTLLEAFSACAITLASSKVKQYFRAQIATSALTIALDILVFGTTVFKTYQHAIGMRWLGQGSISEVLLKDGALYFLAIIPFRAFTLITIHEHSQATNVNTVLSVLSTYLDVLSNLLVNRLYLNLRSWDPQSPPGSSTAAVASTAGPVFAQNRFLGNIGAPLDPDWWENQFDDDADKELGGEELRDNLGALMEENSGDTTLVPMVCDGEGVRDIEMVPAPREGSLSNTA